MSFPTRRTDTLTRANVQAALRHGCSANAALLVHRITGHSFTWPKKERWLRHQGENLDFVLPRLIARVEKLLQPKSKKDDKAGEVAA
jgi:hypothetical protein